MRIVIQRVSRAVTLGGGRCSRCSASINAPDWELEVSGEDAEEVRSVAESLAGSMSKRENPRSPWLSGSFYLAALVIVVTVFLVAATTVHLLVLPVVIIGALVATSLVGAFQLRQDRALSEKNFLALMLLTFKQLPLIRNVRGHEKNLR